MEYKRINIGELIEQRMNELGISKAELARRLNIASQYVNRLFAKDGINTDKLIDISIALDCDFFKYYRPKAEEALVKTSGDFSPASLNGDAQVKIDSNNDGEIELLKKLLDEKERTIQILLDKKKKG